RVGFGSIIAAGQVLRRNVDDGKLVLDVPKSTEGAVREPGGARIDRVIGPNAAFLGQLTALREWYREVRLGRIPPGHEHDEARIVITEAIAAIEACLDERWARLAALVGEHGRKVERPNLQVAACCP